MKHKDEKFLPSSAALKLRQGEQTPVLTIWRRFRFEAAHWLPNVPESFVDAIVGKRLTYARLIAKVPA